MTEYEKKSFELFPNYSNAESIAKTDEFNANEIQFVKRISFRQGYELCLKEYEEKLRSNEKIDKLIIELNRYSEDYNSYEYGLPTHDEHMSNLREIVKSSFLK